MDGFILKVWVTRETRKATRAISRWESTAASPSDSVMSWARCEWTSALRLFEMMVYTWCSYKWMRYWMQLPSIGVQQHWIYGSTGWNVHYEDENIQEESTRWRKNMAAWWILFLGFSHAAVDSMSTCTVYHFVQFERLHQQSSDGDERVEIYFFPFLKKASPNRAAGTYKFPSIL